MAFGVYVHVPFCARRCDYCDFATWTDRSYLVDRYVDACATDLRRWSDCGVPQATSVFFGGGTPSLLEPRQLLRILEAIETVDGAEVTVECNPDSVDRAKLATLHEGGVDRVSFGVQSMVPHVLASLGRTHDPHNVERAMDAAHSVGISRVNVDLIYGAEGESLGDWQTTLDRALGLGPTHVSGYALTVEAGTPLARRVAAGTVVPPDDDEQADKYLALDEAMTAAGLEWYEISNWAHPGDECRHNLLYWHGGEYLGVGCAAHGHTGGRRWWTVRSPDRYVEAVEDHRSPITGGEALGLAERADEAFTLALRTRLGAEVPATARAEVDELVSEGLLAPRAGRVVLTRRGRLLASDVTIRLLAAGIPAGTR